jgi:PAS domain S-box-containing protein
LAQTGPAAPAAPTAPRATPVPAAPRPTGPIREPPTPGLSRPPAPHLGYTVAIAVVGIATALRLVLPISGRNAFFLFYPAVALASWYGGFGPGLLAAALGAVAGNYFFTPPESELTLQLTELIETVLFFLLAGAIAWLMGSARAAQRRAAEAAHQAGERGERFRITLAGIGDGVVVADDAGRVTFLNPVAEQLTGWKSADAEGRPLEEVFKIVNERTRAPMENPVQRVLKDGKTVTLANHTALLAKDGTERLIEDSAAPVRTAQGRVTGVVLIFRDVTEQRRAQSAAGAADAQLRLALQAGQMGAWAWDLKTNRVTWSESLEAIHGLAPGTFPGTLEALLDMVYPDDRAPLRATLDRSLDEAARHNGEAEYQAEYRIVRPDGAVRWVSSNGRVIPGPDGKPERIVGVRYDVTDRRREELRARLLADATRDFAAAQPDLDAVSAAVERHLATARESGEGDDVLLEELRRRAGIALQSARAFAAERTARAEAEEATESRDRFISIASHELRTPITTIKGLSQMVVRAQARGQMDDARLKDTLESINAAADRLNFLVQDLLDVSRLRTGHLTLQLAEVDPGKLVREVLNRHASHLADGRRFGTKVGPAVPTITADPHRVEQVLVNLISNAAKYSPKGSTVHVSVGEEHGGVRVEVRDQGIGLPPGEAESIFEPFGRATNARELPGMGLGLYISRGIVEQHGGRIGAESPGPGRGTTVWFWLPKTPPEDVVAGADTEVPESAATTNGAAHDVIPSPESPVDATPSS